MLETHILCLTYYPVTYFEMLGRPWRDARRLTVPGRRARPRTGWSAIGCGTAQQWFDLCAMTGHQEWIDEESPLSITEQANRARRRALRVGARARRVDEVRDLASAFRIPNAPVANGANVARLDHFVERGAFVANPRDGFVQPGPPYRTQPGAAARAASRRRGSASTPSTTAETDIWVATRARIRAETDVSASAAVRGAAGAGHDDVLGGAVVHARAGACWARRSSTSSRRARPDGTRLIAGIPVTEDQWWEHSPIFSGLNTNKQGLTLDLQSAARARAAATAASRRAT